MHKIGLTFFSSVVQLLTKHCDDYTMPETYSLKRIIF